VGNRMLRTGKRKTMKGRELTTKNPARRRRSRKRGWRMEDQPSLRSYGPASRGWIALTPTLSIRWERVSGLSAIASAKAEGRVRAIPKSFVKLCANLCHCGPARRSRCRKRGWRMEERGWIALTPALSIRWERVSGLSAIASAKAEAASTQRRRGRKGPQDSLRRPLLLPDVGPCFFSTHGLSGPRSILRSILVAVWPRRVPCVKIRVHSCRSPVLRNSAARVDAHAWLSLWKMEPTHRSSPEGYDPAGVGCYVDLFGAWQGGANPGITRAR